MRIKMNERKIFERKRNWNSSIVDNDDDDGSDGMRILIAMETNRQKYRNSRSIFSETQSVQWIEEKKRVSLAY